MRELGLGRRYALASPLLGLALLSGCAHTFTPGPGMTSEDLSRVQSQCRTAAQRAGGGLVTAGDASFILAAGLVTGVGSATKTNNHYNDCMRALGAINQDDAPTTATASSTPVLREPLPPPAAPILAGSSHPAPQPIPLSSPTVRYDSPAIYESGFSPESGRPLNTASNWLRATTVLNKNGGKSRQLYTLLCKSGDTTACVMATSFKHR